MASILIKITQNIKYFRIAFFLTLILFIISLTSLIPIGIISHKHKIANTPTNTIECTVVDYDVKVLDNYCSFYYIAQCPNISTLQQSECLSNHPCLDYSMNKCINTKPINSTLIFTQFATQNKYYGPPEYVNMIHYKKLPLDIFITFPIIMGIIFIMLIVFGFIVFRHKIILYTLPNQEPAVNY